MKPAIPAYAGWAFHPAVGEEPVEGSFRVEAERLVFESEALALELALDRLQVERTAEGQWAFTSPSETDWQVITMQEEVLSNPMLQRNNRLRQQARALREHEDGKRMLKLTGVFVGVCAAIATAFWLLGGWTMNFLVRQVPLSLETAIGEDAFSEIEQKLTFVDDPKLTAQLTALTGRLTAGLPEKRYKFQVQLIRAAVPNAFALPGGRILVTTGLCDSADRLEEIAGVLAHELAHVTRRHGVRSIITAAGPYLVLRVFVSDRSGFLSAVSSGSQVLLHQNYSRDLEREADEIGWQYLVAANIDPRGEIEFFRKLLIHPLTATVETTVPGFLRDHPPTPERIARLEALWERLPKKSGFVALPPIASGDDPDQAVPPKAAAAGRAPRPRRRPKSPQAKPLP